jgi:hypothetical protein
MPVNGAPSEFTLNIGPVNPGARTSSGRLFGSLPLAVRLEREIWIVLETVYVPGASSQSVGAVPAVAKHAESACSVVL